MAALTQAPICGCLHHDGLTHEEYMDLFEEVTIQRRTTHLENVCSWVAAEHHDLQFCIDQLMNDRERYRRRGLIRDVAKLNPQERDRFERLCGKYRDRIREGQAANARAKRRATDADS